MPITGKSPHSGRRNSDCKPDDENGTSGSASSIAYEYSIDLPSSILHLPRLARQRDKLPPTPGAISAQYPRVCSPRDTGSNTTLLISRGAIRTPGEL